MSDNSKLVGSLLVGAAAGAAIAIFLNSEKGTRLKQTVSDKANDLFNDLKQKAEAGKEALTQMTDKVANNLSQKGGSETAKTGSPSEMYV